MRVVACRLEAPVVEAERLRLAILEVKLPVVGLAECVGGEDLRGVGVERITVQERAGVGGGHGVDVGCCAAKANLVVRT